MNFAYSCHKLFFVGAQKEASSVLSDDNFGVQTMAKYLFAYHGGSKPTSPEDVKTVMDAWGAWFGELGAAVIDGGNPVGQSTTVNSDLSVVNDGGANPVSGYGLIEASSLEDAIAKAKGCPVLSSGGSVEVAEAIDM